MRRSLRVCNHPISHYAAVMFYTNDTPAGRSACVAGLFQSCLVFAGSPSKGSSGLHLDNIGCRAPHRDRPDTALSLLSVRSWLCLRDPKLARRVMKRFLFFLCARGVTEMAALGQGQ